MNLGDNLKKIRKENNLSQEDLAEKLGVSRQSISKWESGIAYPELDKILQLCKLFNLNADDLLNQDIKEVKEIKQSKININKYIDDFLDYITKTIDMFSSMSFKEKIKCLFEQCILIFIFFVIACIIGSIGSIIVSNLIGLFPFKVYNAIYNIIMSIYIVLCLVLGVILILHIFKVRYLNYYVIVEKKQEDIVKEQEIKSNETNKDEKIYLEKKKEKIIIRDEKYSGYRFISGLLNFFLKILKIVVACFGIGFCSSLVSLTALVVLSFLFVKAKLLFVGILITLIACILINLVLLYLIYNFIVSRKSKKNKCALMFVISLVMLGIGVALMMIAVTKIDYVDDLNNEKYYITKTESIIMSDDLVIEDRYEYEVEYIESSNNDLKIEYKSSKYYDVNLSKNDKVYYVHFKPNNNTSITKLLNLYIKDINDYKLIDYSKVGVKIYTTKENIDKLKNNLSNYNEEVEKQHMINEYETKIKELEEEIINLKSQINDLENNINN